MIRSNWILVLVTMLTVLFITACGNTEKEAPPDSNASETEQHSNNEATEAEQNTDEAKTDHSHMNHSGSGDVPDGLKESTNPKFPIGSQAVIKEGHMPGMKGAEATIVGAYDTTVYTVSYTPTTGGEMVENHKWVIHEEIKDADDQPYGQGSEVILDADHMEGMKGATAEIISAKQTTVYMIDFTPTDDSEKVTNHKWVTESELTPVENQS